MAYKIERSTPGSKILARYEYDKHGFGFNTADWETSSGSFSISGRALVFTGGTVGAFNMARRIGSTVRASTFIQAVFRVPINNYPGLSCHLTDITPGSFNGIATFLQIDGTSLPTILREFINSGASGAHANDQQTANQIKVVNTDYRLVVHGDGLAIGGYDFANPNHLTRNAAVQADGRTGMLVHGANALHIRRWFECPSRFVTVTGVPSGATVQVQTAAGVSLASAVEAGSGTVQISMHNVTLETAVRLAVIVGSETRATYGEVNGIIEPGETYVFSEVADVPSYALGRSTPGSKMLARFEYDAAFPFNTADWTVQSGMALSLSGGALVLSPSNADGTIRVARLDTVADQAKAFLVTEAVAAHSVPHANNQVQIRPMLGISAIAPETAAGGTLTVQRSAGELVALSSFTAGVTTAVQASTGVAAKAYGTAYFSRLYQASAFIAIRDRTGTLTLSGVAPAVHVGKPGMATIHGVAAGGAGTVTVRRYLLFPDRYVILTGLPAGATAEIRTSADVLLASSLERGGIVEVDCLTVTIETARKIVVKSQFGVELGVYDAGADYIEPGETYALTALSAPTVTAPLADSTQSPPITVAWDAFDFTSGNPVDYALEYSVNDGSSWYPITSGVTALQYIWTPSASLRGLAARVRVRARDTVTDELSGWGSVAFRMAGAATYAAVVLADEPLEYWKLEETVGDFITSSPDGYDATPNGESFTGIQTRGVDAAVCKGILTVPSRNPRCRFFITQRPSAVVFCENFSAEQWVSPVEETTFTVPVGINGLSSTDKMLIVPLHGDGPHVDQSEAGDGIGIGLQVGTNGVCVRQHGSGNLQPATTLQGTGILPAGQNHQIVLVCRRSGFRRTVEIYINGVYGADVPGAVYNEWHVDNRSVGSWPSYGQTNLNVSLDHYYGFTMEGIIDEVSWYDYALTPEQIARHYEAAQNDSGAPGAFTSPDGNIAAGVPILVEWGAAVGADGYVLDHWDGSAWQFLAETTDPEYLWTPEESQASAQLRVIGTVGGFAPACDPQYTESVVFTITSSDELLPPARRAWAFTLDGHVFYVIGSFDGMTLLYDSTTGQWCRWKTGNRLFWNMHRGVMWRGRVLAADREFPVIWELDPSTLLDEGAVEISRAVTGFQPIRGDQSIRQGSLRMVARQQTGAAVDATVTLRFSDDGGNTWSQPKTLLLSDATERLEFRSLGRLRKPGRIWEITDSGGLIRISGIDSQLEGG